MKRNRVDRDLVFEQRLLFDAIDVEMRSDVVIVADIGYVEIRAVLGNFLEIAVLHRKFPLVQDLPVFRI